ncbi:MAG: Phosphoribosylformylglycinamidine synthase 2 [Syntrophaceae bacterium PtaU1.Bin231]|nr:MAG: Phosphoribosylformylglycinamidine synthase 2 [Syntrophaceae bacterium PtaU1.Bin231]
MAHRIEIGLKEGIRDALGEKIKRRIVEHLRIPVDRVRTVDVYTLDGDLDTESLDRAARGPLSDPVIQTAAIDRGLAPAGSFDWLIEVGYRPGVTDNVGKTAREAIGLLLGKRGDQAVPVYTSRQYLITAVRDRCSLDVLTRADAEKIATNLLANELIERFEIVDGKTWNPDRGIAPYVPHVTGTDSPRVGLVDLDVADAELQRISADGMLALTLQEMKIIRDYLRDPAVRSEREEVGLTGQATDAELECLAQTWSEHCKHKIFNAVITYREGMKPAEKIESLFDTYIKGSTQKIRAGLGADDWLLSVFTDNAGVVRFNDDWSLVFKVETHNSPSALDPYGGALTGIVGVNRDPFGTGRGARLIFNTDVFCFAPPDYDKPLPRRILHPRRIYEGVREGVEHGGNKSGIPTVNGCLVFDERYLGKPLVYCGTGGIMPARIGGRPSHLKEILPGDLVVMTGGRIGKDGIHGATFSSEELHEGSPVTAVQIGDPITQKKMTDFLLKARDLDLYRCITDNGAGGLSSSVGETARLSGGCEIDLEKAPLKYAGLNPWEILISESQERMTLAVDPARIDAFLALARKMDVEATVLGRYTDSGKFHVRYGERTVAFLDMDFLHAGLPPMQLEAVWTPPSHPEPDFATPGNLGDALKKMLSRLNLCSKESVVRQYDHEVQGGSVVKPLVGAANDGPGDAAVIRPLLDSFAGIIVSNGICPRYGDIDAYAMAACALDEALRNAIAVGGNLKRIAVLDNFCWCDPVQSEKTPDGEYKLAQLVRANKALYEYTTAFGVPCISGKDSMKNDYMIGDVKISIPPTLLFSALGVMEDVRKAVTMDAKGPGDLVYVLGKTRRELGGSEWFAMHGFIGNGVPQVRIGEAKALYEALSGAIDRGLVASCHDCSDGGLGAALAETAFAGAFGLEVSLRDVPAEGCEREDDLLFSESASRFVVTVAPRFRKAFEKAMKNCAAARIGVVTEQPLLRVEGFSGKMAIEEPIAGLKAAWQRTLSF